MSDDERRAVADDHASDTALGNIDAALEQALTDPAADELDVADEIPEFAEYEDALDEARDISASEIAQFNWLRNKIRKIGRKPRDQIDEELSSLADVDTADKTKSKSLSESQRTTLAQAKCIRRNISRCYRQRKVLVLAECITTACKI